MLNLRQLLYVFIGIPLSITSLARGETGSQAVSTASTSVIGPVIVAAAEAGNWATVESQINAGVDLQAQQPDGMTALHWAVLHSHAPMVKRLLEAGASPKIANRYEVTPLSTACVNGDATIVRLLLEGGADAQTHLAGGETVLMTAARTGRLEPVNLLIEHGANINARDHRQQTAIMWAAAAGHTDVVKRLIEAGADFKTPLDSGFTPLFFAIREGHTETAVALLDQGLDINAPMSGKKRERGPNPLLLAVENGHFETAVALLERGANPNAQPTGHAALHAITWVRKPIRGDGNPSPVGSGNVDALQFVRRLVEVGADVNLRLERGQKGFADFTTTGSTALVLASRTGDLPLLNLLLELSADPQIPNADKATALLAAAGIGDLGSGDEAAGTEDEAIQTIDRLLSLGLDINTVDENGETAIHGAAYQNRPRLIRYLHEHGAKIEVWNQRNRWGWTPLMIARGYREGNFRPDQPTIVVIEELMRAAGITPPKFPDQDVESNQQSWDKKAPMPKPKVTP